MKKIILAGILLILCNSISIAQSKKTAGPLDKKTFTCDLLEEGKKKAEPEKDDFKFATGKFQCKAFTDAGFKPTVYTAEVDSTDSGVTITFSVEATNDKGETFKMDGTVTNDEIEGTGGIYKKEKQKKSYTYTGTLKGKKAAK